MKWTPIIISLFLACFSFAPGISAQQTPPLSSVPPLIQFNGALKAASGSPVVGTFSDICIANPN